MRKEEGCVEKRLECQVCMWYKTAALWMWSIWMVLWQWERLWV